MGYKFRTPGPWGAGQLTDLDPVDVDNNFWLAIQDIAAKSAQGVGISNIFAVGNQITIVLTDHTLFTVTIPVPLPKFRGEWQPSTSYLASDIVTHVGVVYGVPTNHISATTFDPGANDGHGNNFYEELLRMPALVIPDGGAPGTFLRKVTGADQDDAWLTAALSDLSDVLLGISPPPAESDVLTYEHGLWRNRPLPVFSPTLAGLADVLQSPAPTTGDLVYWNGSAFAYLSQAALPQTLAAMTDVALTSPKNDDVLTYNITDALWENLAKQPFQHFTSTAKTLALTDASNFISWDASSAALTIPLHATVAFPEGTKVWLRQTSSGQIVVAGAGGVTLSVPPGRLAKTRTRGSVICVRSNIAASDDWQIDGDLAFTNVALAASGGAAIDPTANDTEVYTLTPTASETITASPAPIGAKLTIIVTTSGASSFTLTFGSGFKSQGTLATGTASGKVFTISFMGDGTNMNELNRSAAM